VVIPKTKKSAKRVKDDTTPWPTREEVEKVMQKEGTVTLAITFNKTKQAFEACSQGGKFVEPLLVDPGQNPVGAIAKPRIAFKGKEWHGRLYPSGQAVFQKSAKPAK